VAAGIEVLHALAKREGSFEFKVDHFDWGGEYYKKHGRMMPENGRSLIQKHDAILFGSAGHPDIPDHITLWGLRLAICQPFDQYANVRPTRVLPGITSPLRSVKHRELDWVIVRENSEGEYAGVGGRVHQGSPLEAATDVAMFTRAGVERIMRFAFRLAQSRPRRLLTVVTKSNAQRHAMVMWDEIATEIASEFKDVTWDKMLVDAMTMRMVMRPETIDTIVATLVLIISARGFGDETDHADFIVLTQNRHTRYPSGVIGLGLRRLRTGLCSAALQNFCDASKVGRTAFIAW
jgi:tartrate dehydrogenase/decarboxylase/D-malate dehydrogenase